LCVYDEFGDFLATLLTFMNLMTWSHDLLEVH